MLWMSNICLEATLEKNILETTSSSAIISDHQSELIKYISKIWLGEQSFLSFGQTYKKGFGAVLELLL